MKFFDDKSKNLKWCNRNYFFIGTILFIALNIILFVTLGNFFFFLHQRLESIEGSNFFTSCYKLFLHFCVNFTHSSWEHVLQNMLGFSFCLMYMERKLGTINLYGMLFALTLFCSLPYWSETYTFTGSSEVWFACFGYVTIDYLFSFRNGYRNKTNVIFGTIVVFLELFRSGFYDDYSEGIRKIKWSIDLPILFQFEIHYVGFLIGIFVGLLTNFVILTCEKNRW